MEALTTGHEVAVTFAPARRVDYATTPLRLVLMAAPTFEIGADSLPRKEIIAYNIYELVNGGDGVVVGDRSLLELLMSNPRGPPGWRMGPTYLS